MIGMISLAEIAIRSVNICLCIAGIYYMLRTQDDQSQNYYRSRQGFMIILALLAAINVTSLVYAFDKSPAVHFLISYPSTVIPLLLVANLFLAVQGKGKYDLESRECKLIALQSIGAKANSTLNLNQIARLTLEEVLKVLKLDGAAIYLSSKHDDYLELLWSEGLLGETEVDLTIISTKEVFSTFKPADVDALYSLDVIGNPDFQICKKLKAIGIKTAFAVKLNSQQESVGIMLLACREKTRLNVEQERFIADISTWLSVAIRNAKLWEDLRKAYLKIVVSFSKAVETKDQYTSGHSENVARLSVELASYLGLNKSEIERAYMGGQLHDIGKIGIPELTLNKKGALIEEEYKAIKEHSYKGFEITRPIDSMIRVSEIILHHHERYDGKGYPLGLAGEQIPFLARVVAIADAFDAMTSDRPYRKGIPYDQALEIIAQNRGTQFDPVLANHFIEMMENLLATMKEREPGRDASEFSIDELLALNRDLLPMDV